MLGVNTTTIGRKAILLLPSLASPCLAWASLESNDCKDLRLRKFCQNKFDTQKRSILLNT